MIRNYPMKILMIKAKRSDDQSRIQYRQYNTDNTIQTDKGGVGEMTFKEMIRIYSRVIWFTIREAMIDVWLIFWPMFSVIGLIMVIIRFWSWVLF